ncbi:MAG TPA: LLM class flavin-dependent oxidoreductase [Actinomycetota bacterium]|nr:LLM class flavin-dependent oxidoreductase [Actinomycetota bacterium]
MNVGIGLPSAVPGTDPRVILEWAARADEAGFSSLGVVDRVRYESLDPLAALSAAAGVTARVRLVTMVVIGPLRITATLAREAYTLNAISAGRLILGLGVGARRDDYDAAGVSHEGRGRRFSEQLEDIRHHWADAGHGNGALSPGLLVGGSTDATFARVARFADGYVHGGGPPKTFERAVNKVWTAWREFGREGSPRLWAQGYFALGDDAAGRGLDYMKDYYAFAGPFADKIAAGLLTTPQSVAQFIRGYREAGCEEVVLLPAVADLGQVDRLADVLASL